jgi:hypothetical protein
VIDYDVGDVVVCVDAGVIKCKSGWRHIGSGIKKGDIIRVDAIAPSRRMGLTCPTCLAVRSNSGELGVAARFRKLPKTTDEFTDQMRRLKPKAKPRVDA